MLDDDRLPLHRDLGSDPEPFGSERFARLLARAAAPAPRRLPDVRDPAVPEPAPEPVLERSSA